jgi:hypothetical protein
MEWRRVTGGFLAAILLLTIALPAMCGQCHVAAAEPSCAHTHKSTAPWHQGAAASGRTGCKNCAAEVVMSGVRQGRETPTAARYDAGCASNLCQVSAAVELSATPAKMRLMEGTQYAVESATQGRFCAPATAASDPRRFGGTTLPSTPQQNLSHTLKI